MKKVMTKVIFMFMFVISIFAFGSSVANAAEEYAKIQNVVVTGHNGTLVFKPDVQIGTQTYQDYYMVEDFTTAVLKLKYISNAGQGTGANYDQNLQYSSNISLVVCKTNDECNVVDIANFTGNNQALMKDGFILPLNVFEGGSKELLKDSESNKAADKLNGTNLTELRSVYKNVTFKEGTYEVEKYNTIYLVIDYETTRKYKKGSFLGIGGEWVTEPVEQYTEVIKFVELSAIGGEVSISSVTKDGKHTATVSSSAGFREISYITTTKDYNFEQLSSEQGKSLKEVFDEKAKEDGNTLTAVSVEGIKASIPAIDSKRLGREYVYKFDKDVVDGTNYYVFAEDGFGNQVIYNIANEGESTPVTKVPSQNEGTPPTNPKDTKVGQIILIVLISVFVLSAVLVIVQRIVDYRRRLY